MFDLEHMMVIGRDLILASRFRTGLRPSPGRWNAAAKV
jgi:hypothetical protein